MTSDQPIGRLMIECDSEACSDIHNSIKLNDVTWICREVILRVLNDPTNKFEVEESFV